MIYHGDCIEVMRTLPENSIDTCVTDPPYELGFMGKKWDSSGIAFQPETWQAVFRVLKPGAILLAFGGTRTYHRMVCAIEDAGFEIRDTIAWVYGSGFPKSYDISKGIDKVNGETGRLYKFTAWMRTTGLTASAINEITDTFMGSHYLTDKSQPAIPTRAIWSTLRPYCGDIPKWVDELVERIEAEREVIKTRRVQRNSESWDSSGGMLAIGEQNFDITAPSTPEAQLWHGWGTALKPAFEPIVVAMKPIDGTYVENALKWGVAGLWIDGGRVEGIKGWPDTRRYAAGQMAGGCGSLGGETVIAPNDGKGRFPANLIHDGSDEVLECFPNVKTGTTGGGTNVMGGVFGNGKPTTSPVREGSSGSAARFFYCAKASRSERNAGLEGMPNVRIKGQPSYLDEGGTNNWTGKENHAIYSQNHHPTVKPIELMRYLVRLTKTPTGGVVLDPFMGSGTTGIACVLEGREFIGIEMNEEYVEIAEKRITHYELPLLVEI